MHISTHILVFPWIYAAWNKLQGNHCSHHWIAESAPVYNPRSAAFSSAKHARQINSYAYITSGVKLITCMFFFVEKFTKLQKLIVNTVLFCAYCRTTTNQYVGGGVTVNNTVQPVSNVSITNTRAISPVRPPSLPSSGNNFETVGGSAFTHSLASPFVQNAFPTLQSQPVEFNHAITYVNKIKVSIIFF